VNRRRTALRRGRSQPTSGKGRRPVNHYGEQALRHWRQYLPASYGRLEDPVRFFTELGEQAEAEIEDRTSNTPDRMSLGRARRTSWPASPRR
jgi:hypothetical protein